MRKEQGGKETILAAIRRAAAELGRAPSRGELRRITGVSHYRVLAAFPTLREAVRAAGLEPNPKGEKISTEDLLADWKRVAEKLGRRPSRAEYVREGRYSAGALTVRFGSWSGISTAKVAKVAKSAKEIRISRESTRRTRINQKPERANHKGHEGTRGKRSDDLKPGAAIRVQRGLTKPEEWNKEGATQSLLRDFDRAPLAAVPATLVGMRRVTDEVAQMVVNTLLAPGSWQLAISQNQNREFNHKGHPYDSSFASSESLRAGYGTQRKSRTELETCDFADRMRLAPRGVNKEGDLGPSLAVNAPLVQDDRWRRADFTARGLYKDRPVMGEPFDRRPMTNAPVNELGVMVLFGMVAAGLGLQVESVQGKFPDCVAKRQVAPGKWQYLRIEFEYESKNFKLHGHDPKGCDMIVCWRHNWKECPAGIEVVELCRLFGMR
jgi:hypothetical protein